MNDLEKSLETLFEGLSPIIYHNTEYSGAVGILKSNTFRLSPALSIGGDRPSLKLKRKSGQFERIDMTKKLYFMSTSRIKYGGYARTMGLHQAVFVLDGQKLSHNYTAIPVAYWSSLMPGSKTPSEELLKRDENEDRLVSNKMEIPNANKYIKQVHVLVDKDLDKTKTSERYKYFFTQLKEINDNAEKLKIPIYFYEDFEAYKLQNIKKSKSFEQLELPVPEQSKSSEHYERFGRSYIEKEVKFVNDFVDASKKVLSSNTYEYFPVFHEYYRESELRDRLTSATSLKGVDATEERKQSVKNLTELMRLVKVTSIEDLIEKVLTKYADLRNKDEKSKKYAPQKFDKFPILNTIRHTVYILSNASSGKLPKEYLEVLKDPNILEKIKKEKETNTPEELEDLKNVEGMIYYHGRDSYFVPEREKDNIDYEKIVKRIVNTIEGYKEETKVENFYEYPILEKIFRTAILLKQYRYDKEDVPEKFKRLINSPKVFDLINKDSTIKSNGDPIEQDTRESEDVQRLFKKITEYVQDMIKYDDNYPKKDVESWEDIIKILREKLK